MSSKLPDVKKKQKKSKKTSKAVEPKPNKYMPDEKMFGMMERRGMYKDTEKEEEKRQKKKKQSGKDRSKNLKKIKKSQTKQSASNNNKRKDQEQKGWDDEQKKRARLKKAAQMVDSFDKNCDPNAKKNNKAARRRQRSLQLQSLKGGNGPQNMPLPKLIPKPKPKPTAASITEANKKKEDEEDIVSSDEETTYAYEKNDSNKAKHKKYTNNTNGVPEEMRAKKWKGFSCNIPNPWIKLKASCGEAAMSAGSKFRHRFQKKKRIDMNAILAPESHKFSIQLDKQLSNKEDTGLLERSLETKPDQHAEGVLEKEIKELTSTEQAQKNLAEAEALARGEEIVDEIEELTTRTALEVICKHISGVDCLHPLKPGRKFVCLLFTWYSGYQRVDLVSIVD